MKKFFEKSIYGIVIVAFCFAMATSVHAMSGGTYAIPADTLNFEGNGSSESYTIQSTVGENGSAPADVTAPSTPTDLDATAVSSSQINLSWTASTDDTAVVGYKIYRGGIVVGTTADTDYEDTGLSAETLYTYRVTAFDAANNESSQSVAASATTQAASSQPSGGGGSGGRTPSQSPTENDQPTTNPPAITPPIESVPVDDIPFAPPENVDSVLRNFDLGQVVFTQDGAPIDFSGATIIVRGDQNLTISIPYEVLPEILKTVIITLHDPDDPEKTFSFMLRINAEKTAYEATIAPLNRSGKFQFTLGVLDYKYQALVKLEGTLVSKLSFWPEVTSRLSSIVQSAFTPIVSAGQFLVTVVAGWWQGIASFFSSFFEK